MGTNDIKAQFIEGTPIRFNLEPYFFNVDGKNYTIPFPFYYDSGSFPFFLRFFDNRKYEHSYMKHDYFYSKLSDIHNQGVSRKKADLILFDDMKGWGRYLIYIGLRLFGGFAWKKDYNYDRYKKVIDRYDEILSQKLK